jgi:hypothetical protein
MVINYKTPCPECKILGNNSNIYFDDGDFLCKEGHKYESMGAIEEQLLLVNAAGFPVESPEPIKIVPPSPPKVVPELTDRIEEELEEEDREAEALKSMTMAPLPPVEPARVDPRALQAVPKPAAVAVAEPPDFGVPGAGPMVVHKKPGTRELEGGNLEITVIIPEQHATFLRGEAEFRGKTVQEHFEELLYHGLDARWWY